PPRAAEPGWHRGRPFRPDEAKGFFAWGAGIPPRGAAVPRPAVRVAAGRAGRTGVAPRRCLRPHDGGAFVFWVRARPGSRPAPAKPRRSRRMQPSLDVYLDLAAGTRVVPCWTRVALDQETPVTLYRKLVGHGP